MALAVSGTWRVVTPRQGAQPIATTQTTQVHALGTIIMAKDVGTTALGEGEFIYLLGVSGTTAGLLVRYNATTYQTTLLVNTANQDVPVAVAMSANVGSQYGWYQITGLASTLKTAVAVTPTVPVYISATAGRVKVVASAGVQVVNCRSANLTTVSAAVSSVMLMINRPFAQGSTT
jgi:hypothetical protein